MLVSCLGVKTQELFCDLSSFPSFPTRSSLIHDQKRMQQCSMTVLPFVCDGITVSKTDKDNLWWAVNEVGGGGELCGC